MKSICDESFQNESFKSEICSGAADSKNLKFLEISFCLYHRVYLMTQHISQRKSAEKQKNHKILTQQKRLFVKSSWEAQQNGSHVWPKLGLNPGGSSSIKGSQLILIGSNWGTSNFFHKLTKAFWESWESVFADLNEFLWTFT